MRNEDTIINENEHRVPEEPAHTSCEEVHDEYKNKYLRLLAEIENTKKRMQKEKQDMIRFTVENVITELLGPIDNLENALNCTDALTGEMKNWAQGFLMILGQFKEVLSHHNITSFHSLHAHFDPNLHFAVEMEETNDVPEGTILQEYVKGYKSGDHIIRPARVKVASAPQKEEANN
jgi:molecular chaperone GrpE